MRNYLSRLRRYFSESGTEGTEGRSGTPDPEEGGRRSRSNRLTVDQARSKRRRHQGHEYDSLSRGDEGHPTSDPEHGEDDDDDGASANASSSVFESSGEEENSTARLSRRSSVLVDLFSLFRRSSSFGGRRQSGRYSSRLFSSQDFGDEEGQKHVSKEKLLAAIRQKKEIIGKLRCQPWNMKRKRRTLKVAQRHLQRQEARVSKVHLYHQEFQKRFKQFARWLANVKIYLIPWESKIRKIESHYGSVVSSYFTFLRWVLGVDILVSLIIVMFVVVPEWLADSRNDPIRFNRTRHFKVMPESMRPHADELNVIWDLGGHAEYSLMFYGYYSAETFFGDTIQYRVPLAYFMVNLCVIGLSFFAILRQMAANARKSKLASGKTEQYVFSWKMFTGWDYNLANPETASNLYMANVNKIREAINEYKVKMHSKMECLLVMGRIFANVFIGMLIIGSGLIIYWCSLQSREDSFWQQNALAISVPLITLVFPNLFELIGRGMEKYHPRQALKCQMARVLTLFIMNYFTLILSLYAMLGNLQVVDVNSTLAELNSPDFDLHLSDLYHPDQASYEVVGRQARQISYQIGAPQGNNADLIYRQLATPPSFVSTPPPAPPKAWTTVFPNFGPFVVSVINPQAVVQKGKSYIPFENGTSYESRVIGPDSDWKVVTEISSNFSDPNEADIEKTKEPITYKKLASSKDLCWESVIGREITKLLLMDLVITIAGVFVVDFVRGLWVRYCEDFWCWSLENTFPEYGEFKLAENILHLVNNQSTMWLGVFFVPVLPIINIIKLVITMYIRGWAVMTCNTPSKQIFRVSRSNNFYLVLLLFMLFLSTIPMGYVIASLHPSKSCGPYSNQDRFYGIVIEVVKQNLPENVVGIIDKVISPGIVIPIMLLLLLIIYFMFNFVSGLRQANHDLTKQLVHERTEEKRKIFELAGGGRHRVSRAAPIVFSRSADTKPLLDHHSPHDNHSHPATVHGPHGVVTVPTNATAAKGHDSVSDDSRRSHQRQFMPSLDSVNESEEYDGQLRVAPAERRLTNNDVIPPVELTLWQKFLICIGWSDPVEVKERVARKSIVKAMEEVHVEEVKKKKGVLRASQIDEEELTEDSEASDDEKTEPKKQKDPPPPPPPKSPEDSSDDEDDRSSFITDEQSLKDGGEHRQNKKHHRKHHSPPMRHSKSPQVSKSKSKSKSRSPAPQGHYRSTASARKEKEPEKQAEESPRSTQRWLDIPKKSGSVTPRSVTPSGAKDSRQGTASADERRSEDDRLPVVDYDPTRPPSSEDSFQDTTPSLSNSFIGTMSPTNLALADPRIEYANPYSSYAAAMASPVLGSRGQVNSETPKSSPKAGTVDPSLLPPPLPKQRFLLLLDDQDRNSESAVSSESYNLDDFPPPQQQMSPRLLPTRTRDYLYHNASFNGSTAPHDPHQTLPPTPVDSPRRTRASTGTPILARAIRNQSDGSSPMSQISMPRFRISMSPPKQLKPDSPMSASMPRRPADYRIESRQANNTLPSSPPSNTRSTGTRASPMQQTTV